MNFSNLNHVILEKVIVQANPGAIIDKCIREITFLALQNDVEIELYHNNKIITANPNSLINQVYATEKKRF